jgi:hypothetical protein
VLTRITLVLFVLAGCASQLPADHPCSERNPEPYRVAAVCTERVDRECKDLPNEACVAWHECMAEFERRCAE